MGKSTNFHGQQIFIQLLNFIEKSEVKKMAGESDYEGYVKKFIT